MVRYHEYGGTIVKRVLLLRRLWCVTGSLALALGLVGCGPKEPGEGPRMEESKTQTTAAPQTAPPPGAAPYSSDEKGAKALLAEFVKPNAEHVALTSGLRPT